jgi:transcription initiation factor TFIIIB Brf1 subunit/transcription initiation factor TFIIB
MASKYDRSIGLVCPTCGGTEFAHDTSDSGPVRCAGCDLELSRDDLIASNGEHIKSAVDELKKEVVKDLKDQLRKAFGGSKTFKVRL